MLSQAVLVNGNFIVAQHAQEIVSGTYKANCSAITMVFVASRKEEVEGGTLFVSGCPNTSEAAMIIAANIEKVIINASPFNADEAIAIEMLQKSGIDVITNISIIL